MKIKTSELTDAALDWAVTRAHLEGETEFTYYIDHKRRVVEEKGDVSWVYSPSTSWAQGGPIIERERINLASGSEWEAAYDDFADVIWKHVGYGSGPTPLIAAMRCYVTSKLGDEVDIPEELTP